jgi:hypothetical protein
MFNSKPFPACPIGLIFLLVGTHEGVDISGEFADAR